MKTAYITYQHTQTHSWKPVKYSCKYISPHVKTQKINDFPEIDTKTHKKMAPAVSSPFCCLNKNKLKWTFSLLKNAVVGGPTIFLKNSVFVNLQNFRFQEFSKHMHVPTNAVETHQDMYILHQAVLIYSSA